MTEPIETTKEQSTTGKKRDALIGTVVADRYELNSLLGRGATTSVYKAKDNSLNKFVAIKILRTDSIFNEQLISRFEQECHTLALLQHVNIVKLLDSGVTDNDQPFLVMEYVDGTSLRDLIEADNCIDFKRILKIFIQICAGLAVAHEKEVVHRDMKPANIMLTKSSQGEELVKILDFGVAKLLVQGETFQTKTQTGEMLGTLLYMSPEQCLDQVLDQRCDVYSVGCVLFETLTGKPPLIGRTAFETMNKHLTEMPPRLSKVRPDRVFDARLDVAVAVSMAKDPEDRYQTITEFQNALSAILANFYKYSVEAIPVRTPAPLPAAVNSSSDLSTVAPNAQMERLSPEEIIELTKANAALFVASVVCFFLGIFVTPYLFLMAAFFFIRLISNNSSTNAPAPVLSNSGVHRQPAEIEDSSRDGTVYFLAMEAADGVDWRTIYKDQIERYNINPSEVIKQKGALVATQEEAWREVKTYVMDAFRRLDRDGDGFVSKKELTAARDETASLSTREHALLTYMIKNLDEIQTIVDNGGDWSKGVRRTDLSEYFLYLEMTEKAKQGN